MKSEIAQMVEQRLFTFFQKVLISNPVYGGFFFNREKQLFVLSPGQNLNYHAETHFLTFPPSS